MKHIILGDNRGAGSSMRHQLDDIPDGGRVMINIENLEISFQRKMGDKLYGARPHQTAS